MTDINPDRLLAHCALGKFDADDHGVNRSRLQCC